VSGTLPDRATGAAGALIVGVLSGALNVSSVSAAPRSPVYAAAQPWSPAQLVATVQAVFLPVNFAVFAVLYSAPVPPGMLAVGAAGTGAGLLAGTYPRGRVPAAAIRSAVLVIAAAEASIILVKAVR